MDVAAWLKGLGLERYEAAFHDNEIDWEALPKLTAEDLKDLGVVLGSHRRKLLESIAALDGKTDAAVEPASAVPAAERRQLTVMFCDLVGSTEIAARLDPEDLREVIAAYHHAVAEVVRGFDGFVAKYMGDGVLAYFGYPRAHEDDAERAVWAGLRSIDAVARLHVNSLQLQARVGIATGPVVVGDLIGEGSAQEQSVVGETPNLAARLQALAGPDQVVIPENTRRLVGNLFEHERLGEVEIKGLAAPVKAFRVVRESPAGSRFEALRTGETPLVGREEEIALLSRRWAQAKAGSGRVVLISAEPGIGKSRLAEAFRASLEGEPHTRLRYFCSPHHQDSALFPFIAQLERAAGFEREDSARLEKLQALVAANEPAEGDVQLLAELLSVPLDGRYPALDLTPQRKKERTFEALLRQLAGLARRQPVLMIFEDLHWADPTSRDLLDLSVERIERLPVLLIATFRPEFQPPWTDQPNITTLSLRRLGRQESDQLVRGIIGDTPALSNEIVDEIIERTDGVPLFVEELTKAVLETAVTGAELSAIPTTSLAVPATLHASLMARLDRLGSVTKEVAQVGATIGREFSYELLAAAARRNEAELQGALSRLIDAGLVFRRGVPSQAMFLFKHALVQEAALGTLLRGPRQLLHARIADALISKSGESPAAPEIVAHHLQSAGRSADAVAYWRKAGEQAVRRAANREAIRHLRRALSLLDTQPKTSERWRTELAVLSQLTPALMSVHGWSGPEAGEAVERAADIARRLPSSAELAPSIANLWMFNQGRGRLDRAEEISADLFRIARDLDDPEILLQAHHCSWGTRHIRGPLRETKEHIDAGLSLYDEERHAHHRYTYVGHDPAVCALASLAFVQWLLGYPSQSRHLEVKALALARRLDHLPSMAHALRHACDVQAVRGDGAAALATAAEFLRLSEEHGLTQARANALIFLGWALACSGESEEGLARLEEGFDVLSRSGNRAFLSRACCLMGESLLASGRSVEGLEQVARALDEAMETGERLYLPRIHRVRAALLVAYGAPNEAAEAAVRQSLAAAQEQGAKGPELQAAIDLARHWVERGRQKAARDLLAPIYGWFTEGFDTPDLKEAKALLSELN
jgi:class 3 adenylate cyclase/predicted ATPase